MHRPHPVVKIFNDSGCETYLIGCPVTGEALLVDPKAGKTTTYTKLLGALQLTLTTVIDTHTHADHLSASTEYLKSGVRVLMSRHTACRRAVTRVADGEAVVVGAMQFTAVELPGHTPDSIGLVGEGIAIVGDTLFAGGLARADFRGSDPALLYESVTKRLMTLPSDTIVFPGHGYADILFTTVGKERAANPALRFSDAAAYLRSLNLTPGAGNTPEVDRTLALNQEEDPTLPESTGAVAACCSMGGAAELAALGRPKEAAPAVLSDERERLTELGLWIDVRERFEYDAEHVTGARSLPLGELGFHLHELRGRHGLVFSCAGGVRSMSAARTLSYLGVAVDPTSLTGGFAAWKALGLATERAENSGS